MMKRRGIPVTRESYIELLFAPNKPPPEWTAEDEAELPPELRKT